MKKAFFLKILIVFMLMFIIFNNVALADGFKVKDTFTGAIESGATQTAQSVQDILITILTVVRIVGMAVALIILVVIGIKIMLASPSERASIKQYATNYLIGAFVLLSASGILTLIQSVANTAFTSQK